MKIITTQKDVSQTHWNPRPDSPLARQVRTSLNNLLSNPAVGGCEEKQSVVRGQSSDQLWTPFYQPWKTAPFYTSFVLAVTALYWPRERMLDLQG